MKKIITILALFYISLSNAQYTHTFEGYTRDDADEIQFTFIPLSISNDQEVNQFELCWRRGAHSAQFRYGIDNDRTNYYDITSNVYFWITRHLDLTLGAGFGTRTNVKFEIKDSTDKFYIPYNFGIILKPSNTFQIISRIEKIDFEHDWYFQTGIILKFTLNK